MKRSLLITLGFIILAAPGIGLAQVQGKQVISRSQVWLGYFNQIRVNDKFSVLLDLHARRTDFLNRWATTLVRPGLSYHVSDQVHATAGYAFAFHWPARENQLTVRPEHRLWQQISWGSKGRRLQLNQRIRLEERFLRKIQQDFLQAGHNFNYRARYMVTLQLPLREAEIKPGSFFAVLSNEILINFGKEIVYNYFDQNRFFAGLGYPFTRSLQAQLGYMRVFQQLPDGNNFFDTHTFRLFLYHNLDMRKPAAP